MPECRIKFIFFYPVLTRILRGQFSPNYPEGNNKQFFHGNLFFISLFWHTASNHHVNHNTVFMASAWFINFHSIVKKILLGYQKKLPKN